MDSPFFAFSYFFPPLFPLFGIYIFGGFYSHLAVGFCDTSHTLFPLECEFGTGFLARGEGVICMVFVILPFVCIPFELRRDLAFSTRSTE